MTTDVNLCSRCNWAEYPPNLNPNRKKCPNCGANFTTREEVRFFG